MEVSLRCISWSQDSLTQAWTAYYYGNPAAFPFEHWIAQSPNVVIVSVYYRLDSIGFLAAPELANDPSLGVLNAGFLE